jgi:hypothetical protein
VRDEPRRGASDDKRYDQQAPSLLSRPGFFQLLVAGVVRLRVGQELDAHYFGGPVVATLHCATASGGEAVTTSDMRSS